MTSRRKASAAIPLTLHDPGACRDAASRVGLTLPIWAHQHLRAAAGLPSLATAQHPPTPTKSTGQVTTLRLTSDESRAIDTAARAAGMSRSTWIASVLHAAAA